LILVFKRIECESAVRGDSKSIGTKAIFSLKTQSVASLSGDLEARFSTTSSSAMDDP